MKKEKSVEKEQEVQSQQEEQVQTSAIEIDRESMSDEEYIEALEQNLGEALSEASTCKGLTQRLQADFDNYRKRNNQIADEMKKLGESIVIEKMLTVLDNCDLARKYIQDESALTGFNMMEGQILSALSGFGLCEVQALGKEFDAKLMSAVERVKDKENDGKVVEVQLKGYMLGDKLLRPASVKIAYWQE